MEGKHEGMNAEVSLRDEIVECERRLRAAQFSSDVPELDALIADELIFVDLAGQIATKAMDLEAHGRRALRLTRSDLKEQEIRCLNEATAVAIVKLGMSGAYEGVEFEGDFRYTRVWQKTPSGWRIVAGHMSAVAAPVANP
ncbi:hypothetical protein IAD21_00722 [Abditibacteriota bacterium]|nr:hypothetical protein IAD21_00722 [Abditibacteriota bacterium]